jgi:hypothetical protein
MMPGATYNKMPDIFTMLSLSLGGLRILGKETPDEEIREKAHQPC